MYSRGLRRCAVAAVLCALSTAAFAAQAGLVSSNPAWTWSNVRPFGDTIYKAAFFDKSEGWAVGLYRGFYHTTDGGGTWEAVRVGPPLGFADIVFKDRQLGWALGNDSGVFNFVAAGVVWNTSDGGKTWKQQLYSDATEGLGTLELAASGDLWACGAAGALFTLKSGGAEWQKVAVPTSVQAYDLIDMAVLPANLIYALGMHRYSHLRTLFVSRDGGLSWEIEDNFETPDLPVKICFTGALVGYAGYANGFIYKTVDGGKSWAQQDNPHSGAVQDNSIQVIQFKDENTGWAVTFDGALVKTVDGGGKWVEVPTSPDPWPAHALVIPDDQTLYLLGVVGYNLKSEDGGASWTKLCAGPMENWFGGFFPDATTGWVVGGGGGMAKTTDGGASWDRVDCHSASTLIDIAFVGGGVGVACGSMGEILRTTDGGDNWDRIQTTIDGNLRSVAFLTDSVGFIGGEEGVLLKTADSGASWTSISADPDYHIFKVVCRGDRLVWTTGSKTVDGKLKGVIKTSTDAGLTWKEHVIRMHNYYTGSSDMVFVSDSEGWVLAHYGTSMDVFPLPVKTTDGGATWEEIPCNVIFGQVQITAISFYDSLRGLMAGEHGALAYTEDGGITWKETAKACPDSKVSKICMRGDGTGFMLGGNAAILRTETGGFDRRSFRVAVPHSPSAYGWQTVLNIINTDGQPRDVNVYARNEKGELVRDSDGYPTSSRFLNRLSSNSMLSGPVGEYFDLLPADQIASLEIFSGETDDLKGKVSAHVEYRAVDGRSTLPYTSADFFHTLYLDHVSIYEPYLSGFWYTGVAVQNTGLVPVDLWFKAKVPVWGKGASIYETVCLKLASGLGPKAAYKTMLSDLLFAELPAGVNPFLVTSGTFEAYLPGSEAVRDSEGQDSVSGIPADALSGCVLVGQGAGESFGTSDAWSMRGKSQESDTTCALFYFPVGVAATIKDVHQSFPLDGGFWVLANYNNTSGRAQLLTFRHYSKEGALLKEAQVSALPGSGKTLSMEVLGFDPRLGGSVSLSVRDFFPMGGQSRGSLEFRTGDKADKACFVAGNRALSLTECGKAFSMPTQVSEGEDTLVVLINPGTQTARFEMATYLEDDPTASGPTSSKRVDYYDLPPNGTMTFCFSEFSKNMSGLSTVGSDQPLAAYYVKTTTGGDRATTAVSISPMGKAAE